MLACTCHGVCVGVGVEGKLYGVTFPTLCPGDCAQVSRALIANHFYLQSHFIDLRDILKLKMHLILFYFFLKCVINSV